MYSTNSTSTQEQMLVNVIRNTDFSTYMDPFNTEYEQRKDPLLQLSEVSRELFSATKESIVRLRRIRIFAMNTENLERPLSRNYSEWIMESMNPRETCNKMRNPQNLYCISRDFVRLVPPPQNYVFFSFFCDHDSPPHTYKKRKRRPLTLLTFFPPVSTEMLFPGIPCRSCGAPSVCGMRFKISSSRG